MRIAPLSALAAALLTLTACGQGVQPQRDVDGNITAAEENADVFSLRVGDCLNTADLGAEILTVPTVPCSEPHDSEVYASMFLSGSEFPGEDAVIDAADEFCFDEFEPFVGQAYEYSELYIFSMYPSADSWRMNDDREILCMVLDETTPGGVTGTLRASGR